VNKLFSRIISPTALLYAFVIIAQIGHGLYFAASEDAGAGYAVITTIGFIWIMGWWLTTDSRRRGVSAVYDLGLFLYVAWPVVLPYYMIKSRGLKGLLIIVGFLGVYIGATVLGMVIYMLLVPGTG
jgi:hypothetical protein